MTIDRLSTPSSDFLTTLAEAADSFRAKGSRPAADRVVEALLQAEKAAKQQRSVYPLEALLGQWRLCFATGTRKLRQRGGIALKKGFYAPKLAPAHISFSSAQPSENHADRGQIGNQVQLGSVLLKLTGPLQYAGKKNLLAFDFTQMQLCLFGRSIYSGSIRGGNKQAQEFYAQSIAKHPFFAFFLVTENFIAARGRGGGLALWIRDA